VEGYVLTLLPETPGTRVPVQIPDGYPGTKIPESPSTTLEVIFGCRTGPADDPLHRASDVLLAWLLDGTSRPLNCPGLFRIS